MCVLPLPVGKREQEMHAETLGKSCKAAWLSANGSILASISDEASLGITLQNLEDGSAQSVQPSQKMGPIAMLWPSNSGKSVLVQTSKGSKPAFWLWSQSSTELHSQTDHPKVIVQTV